jgi:hypothetical protein
MNGYFEVPVVINHILIIDHSGLRLSDDIILETARNFVKCFNDLDLSSLITQRAIYIISYILPFFILILSTLAKAVIHNSFIILKISWKYHCGYFRYGGCHIQLCASHITGSTIDA